MSATGRRFDALLLDFDGTLVDTLPLFEDTLAQLIAEFGLRPLPSNDLQVLRGLGTRGLIDALGLRWWQLPAATRRMRALVAARRDALHLFDGVAGVLQQLHAQGVALQLVTSNRQDTVQAVLGPALLPLFARLHCDVPLMGKRRALARALRCSGQPVARVLSVGDELRDAQASQALGMAIAGVAWGLGLPAQLQATTPLPLLQRPDDLLQCVLGRHAAR